MSGGVWKCKFSILKKYKINDLNRYLNSKRFSTATCFGCCCRKVLRNQRRAPPLGLALNLLLPADLPNIGTSTLDTCSQRGEDHPRSSSRPRTFIAIMPLTSSMTTGIRPPYHVPPRHQARRVSVSRLATSIAGSGSPEQHTVVTIGEALYGELQIILYKTSL